MSSKVSNHFTWGMLVLCSKVIHVDHFSWYQLLIGEREVNEYVQIEK